MPLLSSSRQWRCCTIIDTFISEHQRDLTGSALLRDLPIIVVNLTQQLTTLLRTDKVGRTFLSRVRIDADACRRNLYLKHSVLTAEAAYIGLQFAGYDGDAHELINRRIVPETEQSGPTLWHSLKGAAASDEPLAQALEHLSTEVRHLLMCNEPERYSGRAAELAREVASQIDTYVGDAA